jgi:hypothetical protein
MPTLFRAMKEDTARQPQLGGSARTLGIRLGRDVSALSASDLVHSGQGGMSVSPDDPLHLPLYRRPPEFGGTGTDPVWFLDVADLGPQLCYRPDPKNSGHGFIEPAYPMTADEYRQALEATQPLWRLAGTP